MRRSVDMSHRTDLFTTAAELFNELIEAKDRSELSRVRNRWLRYQLIVIDEMAYVAVPESAELLR